MKFKYPSDKEKWCEAIIVLAPGDKPEHFKKYKYVFGSRRSVSTFCGFAKNKFPTATHVNFYNKATGNFKEQILLE